MDQAPFDLATSDVGGNSSDVELLLDRVELTESGGAIEYIVVINDGDGEADLSGFTLRCKTRRPATPTTPAAGQRSTRT